MKVCSRYLDFIESGDFSCESPQWQDVLAHALKCPDCSTAMQTRAEMLEAMNELPEPAYPVDLHERIITEVEADKSSISELSGWFDNAMEALLRPLELGFTVACILMIVFLFKSEKMEQKYASAKMRPVLVAQAPDDEIKPVEGKNGLDSVTSEEVQEFLGKLEKFNQNRVRTVREPIQENYMPELRLVNDW